MAATRITTNYVVRQLFRCRTKCVPPALMQTCYNSNKLVPLCGIQKPLIFNSISTSAWLYKDKKKEKVKVKKVDDRELGEYVDVENLRASLQLEIDKLQQLYVQQLSTRSSGALVETLKVPFEGQNYELQDLAQIAKKGKNLLALNMAGFPQATVAVMKALRATTLGLNPSQDGTLITVQLPRITKEHRENLAKEAKAAFVECKKALDRIVVTKNKATKQGNLSEDEERRILALLRLVEAEYLQAAEKALKSKQDELKLAD